jgi:hypothetical protein
MGARKRVLRAPSTLRSRDPNFLVIGAMKAGTTSLYHYLRAHPQIEMAGVKELDFFVEEMNWSRGWEWYRRQFARSGEADAVGEASTNYAKYPRHLGVPERISSALPKIRLVYVVREPVDRIRSHYLHRVAQGRERRPMEHALLQDPVYLDTSRYALQIEQYLRHFPPQQLLVITSEALRNNRLQTLSTVYEFLRVQGDVIPSGVEREHYRSDERAKYSPVMGSIRKGVKRVFPAAKRAKELVDSLGKRGPLATSQHGSAQVVTKDRELGGSEGETRIPDALRGVLEERLRDDIVRLHNYMGPDFDGWGIA